MAILIYFEMTREDETEVEYIFGYPEKDRRLVIDKESQQAQPLDGNRDSKFGAVHWKILRGHRDLERWPTSGAYAA